MGCAESTTTEATQDVGVNRDGSERLEPGGTIDVGGSISADNFFFAVQEDGNLVVYQDGGEPIWASDTNGQNAKHLIMQEDGNLVLYSVDDQPLWASNTNGRGSNNSVSMQQDGNLVMYNQSGKPIWCTRTDGGNKSPHWPSGEILNVPQMDAEETMYSGNAIDASGFYFSAQADGNLVVYQDGGDPIWASNTNGQGQGPYRLVMQGDGNLVYYDSADAVIWASNTNGSGATYVKMQDDGNFVMYRGDDSAVWCTRTDGGQTSPSWGPGEMC